MDVAIRRLGPGDEQAVRAAGCLFDRPPDPEATWRLLNEPTHMWVLADADNEAALATYSRAGGREASRPVMLDWDFRQD
jgi:hypothetical protein